MTESVLPVARVGCRARRSGWAVGLFGFDDDEGGAVCAVTLPEMADDARCRVRRTPPAGRRACRALFGGRHLQQFLGDDRIALHDVARHFLVTFVGMCRKRLPSHWPGANRSASFTESS